METLVLTTWGVVILAAPVLLIAWLGAEIAGLLAEVGLKTKKVKVKANEKENGLFVR